MSVLDCFNVGKSREVRENLVCLIKENPVIYFRRTLIQNQPFCGKPSSAPKPNFIKF